MIMFYSSVYYSWRT